MAWADLAWPDLSPEFPEPQPHPAPSKPPVPDDIAEQVQRAERRRGVFVPLCVVAGALIFCAGMDVYRSALVGSYAANTPVPSLLFMLAGLLVATIVPALSVLLVIGPTWRQRQQHLTLMQWQRAHRVWLVRERQLYLASLDAASRVRFEQALRAWQWSDPRIGDSARLDSPRA